MPRASSGVARRMRTASITFRLRRGFGTSRLRRGFGTSRLRQAFGTSRLRRGFGIRALRAIGIRRLRRRFRGGAALEHGNEETVGAVLCRGEAEVIVGGGT